MKTIEIESLLNIFPEHSSCEYIFHFVTQYLISIDLDIICIYLLPNYSRITRFDNDNEQIDHEHLIIGANK